MKAYLEVIVKPLLSEPDALTIVETNDPMGVLLSAKVSKADMGTIIGKSGEMAKAIRYLVRVAGARNHARVSVRFLEPLGSTRIIPESITKTN
jgi:predicted RNA-binding protein YlqC (UPF0109 family)